MKKRFRINAVLCCALLIVLSILTVLLCRSCTDSEAPTYPTIDNAPALYDTAVNVINSAKDLSLQISYKKETLIGNEFITEQSKQHITYEELNTDLMRAYTEETLMVGDQTINITEVYSKDKIYLTVDGCQFQGAMDAEAFIIRHIPAQLLNAELYDTISGIDTDNGYMLTFSDATALESWVQANGASYKQANCTAYISTDGYLTKSIYTVSYAVADINVRLSATVEISYDNASPVQLPENVDNYIELECPDAPRILEKACGYLLDASSINAVCKDSIYCEAFGDQRNQTVTLRTSQDNSWSAQIDTQVELINNSKSGSATTYTQKELFADNVYSISVDNAPPTISDDIDISAMRSYCRDLLVGTIILPQYITGATITEEDNFYTIHFTGNETFAILIDAEACSILYKDDGILRNTAQSYTTTTMNCFLKIDKTTGLPVSSGFDYQGLYSIENLPYQLLYQSDYQYALLNNEPGA